MKIKGEDIMKLLWIKMMYAIKKAFLNIMQIIFTPLANLKIKISDRNYKKIKEKCKKITDEELMERYAKYIVKYLVRNKGKRYNYKEFIVFNNYAKQVTNEDFRKRILYRLDNISYSCKDKILKNWHYHAQKAKLNYEFNSEAHKDMINYEKKLNVILKQKLNELGVYAEYEDIRKKDYKNKNSKYDFYGDWLERIGYEKSLIVKVD